MEEYLDVLNENDLCLFIASLYYRERNARLFYKYPSDLTLPIPMSSSNGNKEFMCPNRALSISSSSKNKDLAWKFI
jgi:ABC-type glycerol-3-phosphate transport system substrate-binding protein